MLIWNLPAETLAESLERREKVPASWSQTPNLHQTGSSTTCRALYMTLAERGERVLLFSSCCSRLRSRPLKSVGGL